MARADLLVYGKLPFLFMWGKLQHKPLLQQQSSWNQFNEMNPFEFGATMCPAPSANRRKLFHKCWRFSFYFSITSKYRSFITIMKILLKSYGMGTGSQPIPKKKKPKTKHKSIALYSHQNVWNNKDINVVSMVLFIWFDFYSTVLSTIL